MVVGQQMDGMWISERGGGEKWNIYKTKKSYRFLGDFQERKKGIETNYDKTPPPKIISGRGAGDCNIGCNNFDQDLCSTRSYHIKNIPGDVKTVYLNRRGGLT